MLFDLHQKRPAASPGAEFYDHPSFAPVKKFGGFYQRNVRNFADTSDLLDKR